MPRCLTSILMICLALGLAICLAQPALASDDPKPTGEPLPEGVVLETGEDNAPSQADERYGHGCTVVCRYPNGPCGWATAKSSQHSTGELCRTARRYASGVCYNHGKTPVTGCSIYKSW